MDQQSFALTGLMSRGGLSNWAVFFLPAETVLIDVGAAPAIKRGLQAGVGAQFGLVGIALMNATRGQQNGEGKALDDWRSELQAKAKRVHVLTDAQVRAVRLHLQATAHQISVVGTDGTTHKFAITNRKAAPALADALAQRFGTRFEQSSTPTFAFLNRYAPFLMS